MTDNGQHFAYTVTLKAHNLAGVGATCPQCNERFYLDNVSIEAEEKCFYCDATSEKFGEICPSCLWIFAERVIKKPDAYGYINDFLVRMSRRDEGMPDVMTWNFQRMTWPDAPPAKLEANT